MKKYFYYFVFVVICCAGFALIGCSGQTTVKLDEPYDFSSNGTYLSWAVVTNANHYTVKVNDNEYDTETNKFDLCQLPSGINRVQVRAKEYSTKDCKYQQSDFSEILYIKKLEAPKFIRFNSTSINWEPIEDASGYEVTIENEARIVVYSAKVASYVSMTEISDYIMKEGQYSISVTALADSKPSLENNTFLFAMISSNSNAGNILTVTHQMEPPTHFMLNAETQCIEWEASGYSSGSEAIIKDSKNHIVYHGEVNKYYQYYSLPISSIDTDYLIDGDLTISIKVLKPDNPMWIVNYHSAIYPLEDSAIADFNIKTDFDAMLPAVERIGFRGATSYITSLTWSSIASSLYEVRLLDAKSNVLYSETVDYEGIYLVDTYNRYVNKIKENGKYSFTVQAICENKDELLIYNNKIIRATKDSEVATFDFTATVNSKVNAPDHLSIDYDYGVGFMWSTVFNATGYLVTVKDASGNVVYTGLGGSSISSHMAVSYYKLDELVKYLKDSGEYTFSVQALGDVNIGINGLSKSLDSDVVECSFYYNKEENSILAI